MRIFTWISRRFLPKKQTFPLVSGLDPSEHCMAEQGSGHREKAMTGALFPAVRNGKKQKFSSVSPTQYRKSEDLTGKQRGRIVLYSLRGQELRSVCE